MGPNPGRLGHTLEAAFFISTGFVVEPEHILDGDRVAFHAHYLRDLHHPPGSVTQAAEVNDEIYRRSNLFANGPGRKIHTCHEDHGFEPGKGVAGTV